MNDDLRAETTSPRDVLKIGDTTPSGLEVKHILGQSSSVVVFTTVDNQQAGDPRPRRPGPE